MAKSKQRTEPMPPDLYRLEVSPRVRRSMVIDQRAVPHANTRLSELELELDNANFSAAADAASDEIIGEESDDLGE